MRTALHTISCSAPSTRRHRRSRRNRRRTRRI